MGQGWVAMQRVEKSLDVPSDATKSRGPSITSNKNQLRSKRSCLKTVDGSDVRFFGYLSSYFPSCLTLRDTHNTNATQRARLYELCVGFGGTIPSVATGERPSQ